MSLGDFESQNAAGFLDLLAAPVFRWSPTESDDETERLWVQLCRVTLGGLPSELISRLKSVDPPHHLPQQRYLQVGSQTSAIDRLCLTRVAQRYWGVGITAGKDLRDISTWASISESADAISALCVVTDLIRDRHPTLEQELFRHATRQTLGRVSSWLGVISSRDGDVLAKRYGLLGRRQETCAAIGESYGVSRARIQQIESGVLRKLGPAIADEIRASSRADSRADALDRAFRSLHTRPGDDVHSTKGLTRLARLDEAWWPCGLAMLSGDEFDSTTLNDWCFVRDWLTHKAGAIWLDDGRNFMKRRSENKSPYMNAARKLLSIHETVSIDVVHEAVLDTWRSQLYSKCKLSVDWLKAFLRNSSLTVVSDDLVRSRPMIPSDELSRTELQLLGALQELGGVAELDELRERLPGLRRQGSTLNQTLYGRTPIVQRLGPSIFGIRGAAQDPERVARLENLAAQRGHPWLNRGGWKRDAKRSLQYRIPSRGVLPDRIRLPNVIADALLESNGRNGPLVWRMPDGIDYSVGVQVSSAGTYLSGVRPALDQLHAVPGDTINLTVKADGSWAIALAAEASAESVIIRIGRGWTSVSL